MTLQILVPHYHETAETVTPLLDSIAISQNVDFGEVGVLICHDGEDIGDLAFERKYPFEIKQFSIPEKGVSAARNALLDASTAEYIMYCDADDMFFNACGLYIVLQGIKQWHFDSLTSCFTEETRMPNGEIVYVNHEKDNIFVHGKVHRRQYLIDNNIRWNENLTEHEDQFFNAQCQSYSSKVKYCPISFYLWKWNDNSKCRHDPLFILKTYAQVIDANDALVGEFLKREMEDRAMLHATSLIFDAYYTMSKPEWVNQKNKEYRRSTELRFADYFRKYKYLWDETPENKKMSISNTVRSRSVMEGMRMEEITIDQWLKHIQRLKRKQDGNKD